MREEDVMYNYQKERPYLFTPEGHEMFSSVRDCAQGLLSQAGAFTVGALLNTSCRHRHSFRFLACVDRMVEIGDIRRVSDEGMTQHHVYTVGIPMSATTTVAREFPWAVGSGPYRPRILRHLAYCDQCGDEICEGDEHRVERERVKVFGGPIGSWSLTRRHVAGPTRYTCERCIAGEARTP